MIWGSIQFMTAIDSLVMAVGAYVGFRIYQKRRN